MHIYESDLKSFRSDFLLAGNAESTVEGYLRQLRKLAEHRPEAITVRHAKDFLAETQRRSPSVAYTAARAIRSFVKWYAAEYATVDWSSDVPWCEEKDVKPQQHRIVEQRGNALFYLIERTGLADALSSGDSDVEMLATSPGG